ncbi:hypothetical protein QC764_211585 [Podospora pseudoanserina]|uniref:Uncharacterized protein n=1 Tax=Podospora pseudoanserina TaxID=2609844 RepID=A0ABR0IIR3_9PEZI|nr:hypothetical protein QC764_211585 [Podospora pseudoanserina]
MSPSSPVGGKPPSHEPVPSVDIDEKAAIRTPKDLEDGQPQPRRKTMTFCRRAMLVLGLTWLVLTGVAMAGPHPRWKMPCHQAEGQQEVADASRDSSFSALLNAASPKSLHDLLHRYFPEKFQDGVWPSERDAVAAVHQANAALATSIVQLAKRDANSTSIETSTNVPEPEPTTSTSSSSVPPVETTTTTTTTTQPSTSVITPSSKPSPTPTPEPTPTTQPGTSLTSPTGNTLPPDDPSSSVPRTTVGASSTSMASSSSSSLSSSSSSQVLSSAVDGETTLTTSTILPDEETSTSTPPPNTSNTRRTSSSIVTTFTQTSNGNVITVTSTTFVYDIPVETTPAGAEEPTVTPSLQNGAPGMQKQQKGSLLAGVIAAMGMFLI